jgi:pimeloyl-ACP methyl ester carboxylesterase
MQHGHVTAGAVSGHAIRRPSLLSALFELGFPLEAATFWLHALNYPWPRVDPADAKVVMLIPGFLAGDATLLPLAEFCRWLGHRTVFAGIWSNSRCPRETLDALAENLAHTRLRSGERVVVIGQSLGGTYARELATRCEQCVERVITLGSPLRAVRDAANPAVVAAANWVAMLRRLRDGCLTESCSCGTALVERDPGDVPATVIYSRTDGIVHWQSCVDRSGSPMVENVEVMTSHVGMGLNVDVYRLIADRLAMPRRGRRALAAIRTSASDVQLVPA